MKMRKQVIGFLALSILAVACAKQRPIQTIKDPEKDRISKAILDGMNAQQAEQIAEVQKAAAKARTEEEKKALLAGLDPETAAKIDPTTFGVKHPTWLSKVTVVKANPYADFVVVGYENEVGAGHFEFTHDKLKFYSDVILAKKKSVNAVNLGLINEWDITHHDAKLKEVDGNVTNQEEEDPDKKWNEKRLFKIDFAKTAIDEEVLFPYFIGAAKKYSCWDKVKTQVVPNSVEISPEYISFVLSVDYKQDPNCLDDARRATNNELTNTVHYRYSYMRFDPKQSADFTPWLLKDENDELNKKFGYFQSRLQHLDKKYDAARDKIFVNRWHPEKDHHFYFTKNFPEKYKWIFNDEKIGIFPITNKMFAEKGLRIRFYIHENDWGNGKAKEFGDLRYSFVNFIEEPVKGGILGLGPSNANPLTGEIVAANLNIYSGKMKAYVELIRILLNREKSKYDNSSLYTSMKQMLGEDHKKWAQAMDPSTTTGQTFYDMLSDSTYSVRWGAIYTASKADQNEPVFKFKSEQQLRAALGHTNAAGNTEEVMDTLKTLRGAANREMDQMKLMLKSRVGQVITDIDTTTSTVKDLLTTGMSPRKIVDAILYRTAIHEFGHNLSLRHNFYGTVDKRNFPAVRQVMTPTGVSDSKPKSSSVMDYTRIRDELEMDFNWEPYDVAALTYLYSGGKIEEKDRKYLYCSDEHSVINAMCQKGDYGTSPSEVLMSLIENYENVYEVSNKRRDIAFWNTSGYPGRVFTMAWDVKKFLALALVGLDGKKLEEHVRKYRQGDHPAEWTEIKQNITLENARTMKLALAFYNAILQQSSADRPYEDDYDDWNHEKKVQGILPDKIFSAFFLMGDEAFDYDPNRPLSDISFLSTMNHPEIAPIGEKIMENLLTIRVDMRPWFISLGRALFAMSATNFSNRNDAQEIEKIRVAKYDQKDITPWLGIPVDPNKTFELDVKLGAVKDPYFKEGSVIGWAFLDGKYYIADRVKNPVAYNVLESIQRMADAGQPVVIPLADIRELHALYGMATGMIRAQ
jgi:hypothetical protein